MNRAGECSEPSNSVGKLRPMRLPFDVPDARRVVVFSHPNHEIALYGYLRRFRPRIVYLTDGGGAHRLEETHRGLSAIGCHDRAVFLGRTEASLYDAFLDVDLAFWRRLADDVRAAIGPDRPDHVLCDAVELYNPVHDATLPLVRSALGPCDDVDVFEIPLVFERAGHPDNLAVQSVPVSRLGSVVSIELTDDEIEAKLIARDRTYSLLRGQLGVSIVDVPRDRLAVETVIRHDGRLFGPDAEVGNRYERRGNLLAARGEVSRVIRRLDHWLPVADALTDGRSHGYAGG